MFSWRAGGCQDEACPDAPGPPRGAIAACLVRTADVRHS
jgi:hypothetical protein